MVVASTGERRLPRLPGLHLAAKACGVLLLLPHLLIEMSVLLEPEPIHSLPFHFHEVVDGVELPLGDQVRLFLPLVFSKSLFVVEEDGLVVWPEVFDLLLLVGLAN